MSSRLLSHTTRQLAESCSFIPVLHCEQNATSDTYAGITPPFAPEYIGRTAYVNNNLGFVRKAEQSGRAIGLLGPCTWELQVVLNPPLFRVANQVSRRESRLGSRRREVEFLHDFVQAMADSTRRY